MNEVKALRELLVLLGRGITQADFSQSFARLPGWLVDTAAERELLTMEVRKPLDELAFPHRISAECSEYLDGTFSEIVDDTSRGGGVFTPHYRVYICLFALSMLKRGTHQSIDALIAYPEVFAQLVRSLRAMDGNTIDLCGRTLEELFRGDDPELVSLSQLATICAGMGRSVALAARAASQLSQEAERIGDDSTNIWRSPPLRERVQLWQTVLLETVASIESLQGNLMSAARMGDPSK